MALVITIASVDRTAWLKRGTLDIQWPTMYQSTASMKLVSTSGAWAPVVNDAITIANGATTYFGGLIVGVRRQRRNRRGGFYIEIDCSDNNTYLRQRIVKDFTIAEGDTTRTILSNLQSGYLTPFSITFDAGIAAGVAHHAMTYDGRYLNEVIAEVIAGDGWTCWVDNTKVLRAAAPGATSAPAALDETDAYMLGAEWEQSRDEYVNYATARIGGSFAGAAVDKWDQFTGDGSTRNFPLRTYPVYAIPLVVSVARGGVGWPDYSVDWYGGDPASAQEFSYVSPGYTATPAGWPTGRQGIYHSTAYTVMGVTDIFRVGYRVMFPVEVVSPAVMPATPSEALVPMPDCTDIPQAQAVLDALVAAKSAMPKRLSVKTTRAGYRPGQQVTIALASLGVASATRYIQEVRATDIEEKPFTSTRILEYEVIATDSAASTDPFRDYYAQLGGVQQAGGTVVTVTNTTTAAPATLTAHLGGSRTEDVEGTGWQAVPLFQVFKAPYTGTLTARVGRKTRNAGTSVQVRVYDLSAAAVAATGTASTATAWEEETFAVEVVAGHRYQMEVAAGNATYGVFVGQATLEA